MQDSHIEQRKILFLILMLAVLALGLYWVKNYKGQYFSALVGLEQDPASFARAETETGQSRQMRAVCINSATKEELCRLSGIGEVLAARIISYREKHGGFKTSSELMQVKGIKQKKYDRIKEYVDVE